jgi:hypothetical protein
MLPFGCFEAGAADVPDHLVITYVFPVQLHEETVALAAEIDEAIWMRSMRSVATGTGPLFENARLTSPIGRTGERDDYLRRDGRR